MGHGSDGNGITKIVWGNGKRNREALHTRLLQSIHRTKEKSLTPSVTSTHTQERKKVFPMDTSIHVVKVLEREMKRNGQESAIKDLARFMWIYRYVEIIYTS